jgi:hypothetical protein
LDFAATEQSRNAITGQFLVKECRPGCCVTGTRSGFGDNGSSVVNTLAKAGIELGENVFGAMLCRVVRLQFRLQTSLKSDS